MPPARWADISSAGPSTPVSACALTRQPRTAGLPDAVELATGDVPRPDTVALAAASATCARDHAEAFMVTATVGLRAKIDIDPDV